MGKRNEKVTELQYSIEALEDELEHWQEVAAEDQARIIELITENDRLTLTYEPCIPEHDEDHGLSFYGLKEENDVLTQKVLNFMEIIREQEALIEAQDDEIYVLTSAKESFVNSKPKHFGVLSFDFWPLREWCRLSLDKWNPGQAFQVCVGPVRFDWAAT